MRINTRTIMRTVGIAGLLLVGPLAQADDGGMEAMKYPASCKMEGADATKCMEARRELVKYSMHCKAEGEDGKRCMQAREVVKAKKMAEQPDVAGAAPATAKAAPAAAMSGAGKDEMDMKYALHCKAEGDDGKHCMGMRDKVGKYAAQCKAEGADGERCMTARKVVSTLSGK